MTDVVTPGALSAPGVLRSELPGGLRVVTETVAGVRSVSLGIWIGIGSRDESPEQAGAAHYLEHLLFKGTRRRTAKEIAEELDAVGGDLNAFTAKEHTCYYAHVLDTDLPLAVEVLADVVTDATLHPSDVEIERSVVLEEIAMRDDDPEDLLGELSDEALFGDHPLGRPVIGSEESVRGMGRDTLHAFWQGQYTTPRMIVAAAGNLRHGEVVELVGTALAAADGPGERRAACQPAAPRGRAAGPGSAARAAPGGHRAGARAAGRARAVPARPAALGAVGAQHRTRRWAELAAVPAGAGAARAGVLGVLVVGVLRRRGRLQRVRGLRAGAAGGGRHGHPGRALRGGGATGSPRPKSFARKATCGAASCSGWRTRRRG